MNYRETIPATRCRIPHCRMRNPGLAFALRMLGLALLPMLAGCWLFEDDTVPPTCRIVHPTDSSVVSGVVLVRAEASDTNSLTGVTAVRFYAGGSLLGADSTEPYETTWDTKDLANQSWHRLWCAANDLADNVGHSDTVSVQVTHGGARDVFHGRFNLSPGYYWPALFSAEPPDTLVGDFRIAGSGALSRFIWMNAQNYREFQAGRSYTPLLEQTNRAEFSVRAAVASKDSFYLVFLNTSGSTIDCWVRFYLE